MRHGFILSCVAASVITLFSHAASAHIRYDFTALSTEYAFTPGDTFTGSISVTLPSFYTAIAPDSLNISGDSTCTAKSTIGQTVSCSASYRYLGIYGDAPDTLDIVTIGIDTPQGQAGFDFGFAGNAYSTLGLHNSVPRFANDKDVGTLNVTDLDAADVPAVPEPATWTTLLGGCGVIGWALRRRQAAPAA